ncbi:MAG: anthranilate phosphoribosyltransferase [Legionellaceae bacterium]|nr:anthranilate phosphoribosyltransferase [Legionellaceae bacterium]
MSAILPILNQLIGRQSLSEAQSYACFRLLMDAPIEQQAALLTLLTSKIMTAAEIKGALRYFLEQGMSIAYPRHVIDIVGTGGDGFNTFNISTAASIVAASAGALVAKHGGRASSSQTGSADVAMQLGLPLFESPDAICKSLERHRYAYVCGAYFNPLLKQFAPLRKHLGFRTLLNVLGPLANPLRPQAMLIGVYTKDLLRPVAEVLQVLGKQHVMLVSSAEGMDELSLSAPSYVVELMPDGELREYTVTPEALGLKSAPIQAVKGGSAKDNAALIEGVLSGDITHAKRDIVLLNAAGGLVVAGKALNLKEGVQLAREAITSGKAYQQLKRIREDACITF